MQCEYRIDVINALSALTDELSALCSNIVSDKSLPSWLAPLPYPPLAHGTPREQTCRLYQQISYLDEQEGREILIGVGIIGASNSTLAQALKVNKAKLKFKSAILALKSQKLSLTDDWLIEAFASLFSNMRHEYTAVALSSTGLSRLHLKQCYRQVPILDRLPTKVSWSWANTRAIKKISKKDAIALLSKKGSDQGIQNQIEQVNLMHKEEQIAIVQTLAPHLRTNVVLPGPGDTVERQMMKGSLPLIYPAQNSSELPVIKPPKEKKITQRQERNDVKIDPEPFLPAIRGHKYLAS